MTNQSSHSTEENRVAAGKIMDIFQFRQKLNTIFESSEDNLIYILTANIAIFGVMASSILTNQNIVTEKEISILIKCTAAISFISVLLNIWFAKRLQIRLKILRGKQDVIYKKVENNIAKYVYLIRRVTKSNAIQSSLKIPTGQDNFRAIPHSGIENDIDYIDNNLADDSLFIPLSLIELGIKETQISLGKALNEPLDEKYSHLKLFIDRLSDKFKSFGLVIGSSLTLIILLLK